MKQGVIVNHLITSAATSAALLVAATAVAKEPVYLEAPQDPPAVNRAVDDPAARTPGRRFRIGAYTSVQVNVDGAGNNISGDAANEPSIAVNATNSDNIVIGWRQFDSITSNFRQAGNAFSFDGGQTWTVPGVLTPGVFRSDPVLATSSGGKLLYQSLKETFLMDTFVSVDGGLDYGTPVPSFGGDKNWLAVDTSGGIGDGHAYGVWQVFFGCCGNDTLTRSINEGDSWQSPVNVALNPLFGTMAVGPDGVLYVGGIEGTQTQDYDQFVVSRSTNAQNPAQNPVFTGARVDMGGSMEIFSGPNPEGLAGQANVFVDRSQKASRGNVYLLASVNPPGSDPLDVHIIRSEDGGASWSAPVRVNDDNGNNWQWLAAADVALDGRIDVIWADTRGSGQTNISQIFYAWSYDGGRSWSDNVAITPPFDSFVGWPRQNKMGDYFQVVSGREDASVAYAATLNGEQDVYYARLFPDCNDNGRSDVTDIDSGDSEDVDADGVPDECAMAGPMLAAPDPGVAGVANDFVVTGAGAGAVVVYYFGGPSGSSPVNGCPGLELDLRGGRPFGFEIADAEGNATLTRNIPAPLGGRTLGFQAVDRSACEMSNAVTVTFP
jgi:hypothetical protein